MATKRDENFRRTAELCERWFGSDAHPYRVLESRVAASLGPDSTLLDAGCGRTAPVLSKFRGRAGRLVGIDLVDFTQPVDGCDLYQRDLANTRLPDASVDVVYSRSVFEHLDNPAAVLEEFDRILKPGGRCLVLTASLWDYATIIARLVPNRLHPKIVAQTEGRAPEDVFPTRYRCNTRGAVQKCASAAGLKVDSFEYLGQYPAYFLFSPTLFTIASGYEKLIRRFRPLHPLLGWILFSLRKPS